MLVVLLFSQAGYEEMSLEELLNIQVEVVSRYEESVREAPASVVVITGQDMEALGLRTIADVLDYALGTFAAYDRTYHFASVRGFIFPEDWNTRVLLLVDGHPINEPWNSYAPIGDDIPIPFEAIDQIEIARGPSSPVYGTSAFWGVINIKTKRKGTSISASSLYPGSGGEARAYYSAKAKSLRLWAAGSYANMVYPDLNLPEEVVDYPVNYDGDSVYGGLARGVDYTRRYYSLFGFGIGGLEVNMSAYERIAGVPYADYEAVYGEKDNRVQDTHQYIDISYQEGIGPWTVALQGYWDHYIYRDFYHYADPDSSDYGVPAYIYPWKGEPFWWGVDVRSFYASQWLKVLFGATYQHKRVYQSAWAESLDGETLDVVNLTHPVVSQDLFAPYAEVEGISSLGRLSLGARYDHYSDYGGIIVPRAGSVVNMPGGAALKLIYSKAFRAPSIYEAYMEDSMSIVANPLLKPEIIEGTEAWLFWARGGFLLSLGGFFQFIYDGIRDSMIDTVEMYVNAGKFRNTGAEGEVRFRIGPAEPFLSATLPLVRAWSDGRWEEAAFAPRWLVKSGIAVRKGAFSGSLWGIGIGPRLDRERGTLGPQFRLNASLSAYSGSGFGARVSLLNLTDSAYEHPLDEHFVPLYTEDRGRTLRGEVFWGR
jgi:iron complex outermembrane receptor protein